MASSGSAGGSAADPNAALSILQQVQSRYVGTGHSEMTQHEWATNQHRDSIASYIGHDSMLDYFSIAEGISSGRARINLLQRLHSPCGPPPTKRNLDKV